MQNPLSGIASSALCAALLYFLALPLIPDAVGQNKPAAKPKSDARKWSFSFLPTSLQLNPLLDFTIVTEMTDEGRKLPPPDFKKPVYYLMTSAGHHTEGDAQGNTAPMKIEQLKGRLTEALASNGYRPADEQNPPTQILRLVWGEHNTIASFDDIETQSTDAEGETTTTTTITPSIGLGQGYAITIDNYKNILSRAKIVGGNTFAKEMEAAMIEQAQSPVRGGNIGPFTRFLNRDDNHLTSNLVAQVFGSCYYLIVQSFDAAAFAKNRERVLLWQTNMTTPAQGVSLDQTMPGLIENGAYFFGRETKVPEIVTKRPVKEGRVEIGEAEVKEYITAPPASGPKSEKDVANPK